MKKNLSTRVISFFMSFAMLFQVLPITVFAAMNPPTIVSVGEINVDQETNMGGAPTVIIGQPYSAQVNATGADLTYKAGAGSYMKLPEGLTIDPETGLISGTCTAEIGRYDAYIEVSNAAGTAHAVVGFTVGDSSLAPTITTAEGSLGTTYKNANSQFIVSIDNSNTAASAIYDFRWSLKSGSLPTGMKLAYVDNPDLYIVGKPTEIGTFTLELEAKNVFGSNTKTFSFEVVEGSIAPEIVISLGSLGYGVVGEAYEYQLEATGTNSNEDPILWSKYEDDFTQESYELVNGLLLSKTGLITGVPQNNSQVNLRVYAKNSKGSDCEDFYITIYDNGQASSVSITPEIFVLEKGSTQEFTVSLDGYGDVVQEAYWTFYRNENTLPYPTDSELSVDASTPSKTVTLTVGENEERKQFTVVAYSKPGNGGAMGYATVTVSDVEDKFITQPQSKQLAIGEPFYPTWELNFEPTEVIIEYYDGYEWKILSTNANSTGGTILAQEGTLSLRVKATKDGDSIYSDIFEPSWVDSYEFSVTPNSLNWGNVNWGNLASYTEKIVTIENTGNKTYYVESSSHEGFNISIANDTTPLAPGDETLLYITPKNTIAAGNYDFNLTIKATDGEEKWSMDLPVSINVVGASFVTEPQGGIVDINDTYTIIFELDRQPDSLALQWYNDYTSAWVAVMGVELEADATSAIIPAESSEITKKYRILATYGSNSITSDEFNVIWKELYAINCVAHNISDGEVAGTVYLETDIFSYDGAAAYGHATKDSPIKINAEAKSGYEFVEWRKGAPADPEAMISEDAYYELEATENVMWLYAIFQKTSTYTVTFNSNGGTAVDSQVVNAGEKAMKPENPTRDDGTFGSWYKDEELTETFDFVNETITGDITLYAGWTVYVYAHTYNATTDETNTNTAGIFKLNAQEAELVNQAIGILEGTELTLTAIPKEGYRFVEWRSGTTDGTVVSTNAAYTFNASKMTLYAVFEKIYTVTFESNGGSTVASIQNVPEGSTIVEPTKPKKAGYRFEGWYKESELTNEFNFATDTIIADTTLYAKWQESVTEFTLASTDLAAPVYGENIALPTVTIESVTPSTLKESTELDIFWERTDPYIRIDENYINNNSPKFEAGRYTLYIYVENSNGIGDGESYIFDSITINGIEFESAARANTYQGYSHDFEVNAPATCTVIFETYHGSTVESQIINIGEKATRPAENPTKDGYTFAGWYVDGEYTAEFDFDTAVSEDTTVHAKWDVAAPTTCTVIFETYHGSTVESQIINIGEKATRPAENPTKDGYTFAGWYVDGEYTAEFDFDTAVSEDTTVHAKWDVAAPTTCTVIFETYHGSTVESQIINIGEKATRPAENPTKDGYTFAGWYVDGEYTAEFDFDTAVSEDTTVHAKWDVAAPTTCTVIFETYHGSTVESQIINIGEKATRPAENPTKDGYTFAGWYVDGEYTAEFDFDTAVSEDTTVHAKWDVAAPTTCTVIFETYHGSTVESQIINIGEKATRPAENPTKDGYTFAGWYVDGEYTAEFDFDTAVSEDTTVHAKWDVAAPTTCTVIFETYHGSTVESQIINIGEKATRPAENPTKDGYTFAGWYVDGEYTAEFDFDTAVSEDTTVHAKWDVAAPTTCTVIFETYHGSTVESQIINIGEKATRPAENPTKDGYTFAGWYVDGEYTAEFDFDTAVSEDTTVHAKWDVAAPTTCTVIFETYHGSTVESQIINIGEKATRPAENPTKDGYTFAGWYVDGEYTAEFDFDTAVSEDTTVHAKWDVAAPTTCTVIFETYHGSTVESQIINIGEKATRPTENPTKDGYTFAGWYVDGEYTAEFDFDTAVSVDTTIHAKWTKKTLGGGGGGGSATTKYTITVKQNDNGTISPETTKVEKGDNQKFDIKADKGYEVEKVLVDGKSVGAITEYTFENVKAKHTIEATFKKVEEVIEETWKNPFTDVDEDDWYYESVKFANENKLFNGVSSTEFGPNVSMTRAMLVTVLYRLAGEPATNKSIPFADVDMSSYYASAVIWAKQNNIVNGVDDSNFAPNGEITREQLATILYRYANYKGIDVSVGENTNILSYDDFSELSEYAIPAMQWACGSGVITGRTISTIAPKGTATRAEVATMLMRFTK